MVCYYLGVCSMSNLALWGSAMPTMNEHELIARHIEPDSCRTAPHEARLVEHGVSVWALVAYLEVVNGDVRQLAEDYDVPLEAVQAALAYYQRHKDLIDARIALNAADVDA